MVMRAGENERDLILIRFFKAKIRVQYDPFLNLTSKREIKRK